MQVEQVGRGERRGVSPPVEAGGDCTLYRRTYVAPLARCCMVT
jgi:hypothetical protein